LLPNCVPIIEEKTYRGTALVIGWYKLAAAAAQIVRVGAEVAPIGNLASRPSTGVAAATRAGVIAGQVEVESKTRPELQRRDEEGGLDPGLSDDQSQWVWSLLVEFRAWARNLRAVASECRARNGPIQLWFVCRDGCYIARLPAGMTFEQAATLPVAYLTAYYALHHLATFAGESGCSSMRDGGVGLAASGPFALRNLRHRGPAAGSTAMARCAVRDGLRNLNFADEVLEATNGEGWTNSEFAVWPGDSEKLGHPGLRPLLEIGKATSMPIAGSECLPPQPLVHATISMVRCVIARRH
jgi:hypothetical protein